MNFRKWFQELWKQFLKCRRESRNPAKKFKIKNKLLKKKL